jgi:hypothetical protein
VTKLHLSLYSKTVAVLVCFGVMCTEHHFTHETVQRDDSGHTHQEHNRPDGFSLKMVSGATATGSAFRGMRDATLAPVFLRFT